MAAVKMVIGAARDASIPASVWGMNEDGTVEWTYDTAGTVNFVKREPSTGYFWIAGIAADNGDGNGTRNVWVLDSSGNYVKGGYVDSNPTIYCIDLDSNYAYFSGSDGGKAYRTDLDFSNVSTIYSSSFSAIKRIKVDSSGNVYFGGGGNPPTLRKHDSSLNWVWNYDTNDTLWGLEILSNGDLIAGTSDGEARYYKADGTSPNAGEWAYVSDTSFDEIEIAIDSNDNIYVVNQEQGILALINTSGVEQWKYDGEPQFKRGVLDSNEDLWIVGNYLQNHNIFWGDVSEQAVYGMMYDTNRSTTIRAIDIDPSFSYSGELGDNLEGFWKMNDNDASPNVDDSSPNNRDGTATKNTSAMSTTGKVNEALSFVEDGSDSDEVNVGDLSVFDLGPNENKSIAFWMKWTGDGTDNINVMHKCDGATETDTGWVVRLRGDSNYCFFDVNGTPSAGAGIDLDNLDGAPTDWHLIVVRVDRNGNVTISGDNRKDTDADAISDPSADLSISVPMYLGGYLILSLTVGQDGWDGDLDCVGFWSRILTEEEENQIWNSGNGTEDFGLVDPPVITDQSTDTDANFGDNVTFSVTVSGTSPFTYQWYKDGSPITGETSSSITLSSVDASDGADYTCTATNAAGSDTSSAITLRIIPYITAQTNSTSIARGSEAFLSITGNGSPSPTYQWYKGGNIISGETSSTLTKFWTDSDAGTYTCILTNGAGSTTSSDIVITIVDNPYVYNLFNLPHDIERETN